MALSVFQLQHRFSLMLVNLLLQVLLHCFTVGALQHDLLEVEQIL
jgi:hypothetical protein